MKLTVLGSGTSHGVPVIGCTCPVCMSTNPKNRRTRSSLWVEVDGQSIVIDTATEFRLQAVAAGIPRLDAVLYTHHHADHIMGLDDIRPFNEIRDGAVPCYGKKETLETIRQQFAYAFLDTDWGGGKPQFDLRPVDGPFQIGRTLVEPIPVYHGRRLIFGYRIGRVAYLTDASAIPEESLALLNGLDVLVINGLRFRPHQTHFNIAQALEVIDRLQPQQAFLTHLCHDVEHEATNAGLPAGVELAYDGLVLEVD